MAESFFCSPTPTRIDERPGFGDDSAMQDTASLLPLVIGVTGHRNPAVETVAALERAFEERLGMLDALAPNTPFVLLTPLALGCDRIAARVAMRFKRSRAGLGIEIIAVLPFALDDYRQDFAGDAADAAEFEELLAKVDDSIELPRREGAATDGRGFVTHRDDRDLHYRRLGLFVALQSQVMIAMWDGVRNNKVGGTAEVVDFCLGVQAVGEDCGIPFRKTRWLLVAPDKTPVLCIPTRREGAGEPLDAAHGLARSGLSSESRRGLQDLDLMNLRLQRCARKGWKSAMLEATPAAAVVRPWDRLANRFMRLDALGIEAKGEHMNSAWLIPACATIGIIAFQWYSSWASDYARYAWVPLVLYASFLSTACALWWAFVAHRRSEWVFVHARALAEAMRIQIAWIGCGIQDVATDRYLARRGTEVAFLRAQLRAALLDAMLIAAKGGFGASGEDHRVGRLWIAEQAQYFSEHGKATTTRARNNKLQSMVAWLLKLLVLCLSLALLGVSIYATISGSEMVSWSAAWGCFFVGVALALAVAFGYWKDVRLDKEDLEISARMRGVYQMALKRLDERPAEALETIRAMGLEAIDEHVDWFGRHRDRLRLPDAG
jgi:hypothetical protein